MISTGKGVEQSDSKAEAHFGLACKEKHLQACYHQAIMMYSAADGVKPTTTGSSMTASAAATITENSVAPKIDEKVRQLGPKMIYQLHKLPADVVCFVDLKYFSLRSEMKL